MKFLIYPYPHCPPPVLSAGWARPRSRSWARPPWCTRPRGSRPLGAARLPPVGNLSSNSFPLYSKFVPSGSKLQTYMQSSHKLIDGFFHKGDRLPPQGMTDSMKCHPLFKFLHKWAKTSKDVRTTISKSFYRSLCDRNLDDDIEKNYLI